MITIRMMTESESDRMIFSVSGIKGNEMQIFASMLAGMFAGNPNIDFSHEGNCTDLEPAVEEQQMPIMPKKLQEINEADVPVAPEVPPVINDGAETDSAIEVIPLDDDLEDDSSESTGLVNNDTGNNIPDFVLEAEMEAELTAANNTGTNVASNISSDSAPVANKNSANNTSNHVTLNISYNEKTKAKELLGRLIHWDNINKCWYCYEDKLNEVLEKTRDWKADIIKY